MTGLTKTLAAFVADTQARSIDEVLREKTKKAVVDTFACIVAGAASESAGPLMAYARRAAVAGETPILATGLTSSAEIAALVNGTFGHALEYDDVFPIMPGHPSAVIVAALIGDLHSRRVSGTELIEAFVIGYEVGARIGLGITLEHWLKGFHATATLGIFAAVGSLCRLRKLDAETTARAFGAAASFSSGLMRQIGTSMKPVHTGWAARNAIVAVELAECGLTTAADALEGKKGFFAAYGTPSSNAERAGEAIASPWVVLSPGITLKKFPCCFATHRAIDAITTLKSEQGFGLSDVASIFCRTPPNGLNALIYKRPVTGLQGKFSMEYALVATLLDGPPMLPSFTDEAVVRPHAQEALALVEVVEDSACDPTSTGLPTQVTGSRGFVHVTVTLKNGRQFVQRVDHPPGHPSRELSWDDLGQKVEICLGHARFDNARIVAAREALLTLERAIPALAQDYPSRNVTIIVPYPPGGSIDRLARQVADHLSRSLSRPFIVENRPGGNGIIAVEQVRKASPDGHTLLIGGNSTHSIGPATDLAIKYDPIKDFLPIAYLGDTPIVITAGLSFKPRNVPEIADRAKAKARSVSYAAVGHSMFLAGRLFEKATGADMRHVPYKGFGTTVLDIARGDINLGISTIPIVIGGIESKMVRPVAVTSASRIAILPDVPTVAETYPGSDALKRAS